MVAAERESSRRGQRLGERSQLDTELPQMVIEVFVHSSAPGLRRQRTEERVGMPRASGFSAFGELPDLHYHGVVDASAKSSLDRGQVGSVAVRSWLNGGRQAGSQIVHELSAALASGSGSI